MKQDRVGHVPEKNECILKQIRKKSELCSSIIVPSGNQLHRWNYYVMPRGINRQEIFEDDEDYIQFLRSLHFAKCDA